LVVHAERVGTTRASLEAGARSRRNFLKVAFPLPAFSTIRSMMPDIPG
jgi:ABC-type spermidine/putrescine transport system permease subunit I